MTAPEISLRDAAALATPGSRLLLAGCAAEPVALLDVVAANPTLWQNVTLTGAFIPGVNERNYAELGQGTRVETIFTTSGLQPGVEAGRVRHLPVHYSDFARRLAQPGLVDLIYAVIPPPAEDGTIGLGLCADFVPSALKGGARMVGIVSRHMPDVAHGPRLPLSRLEATADGGDTPLSELPQPGTEPVSQAIATHIAGLIPEGGTLQLGLGRLQTAILQRLAMDGRRGLAYHAGMISPAVTAAMQVFGNGISTGVALGHAAFYESLSNCEGIRFLPVEETHSLERLAALPGLVAVNSGLEVDLTGQVNAEFVRGRQQGGQGGLVDFLRGARRSEGGLAVIALPATARSGSTSRITRRLPPGAAVSVARADVDMVVTEYGIADLRGASLEERASRLTAIAAPEFRADLSDQVTYP